MGCWGKSAAGLIWPVSQTLLAPTLKGLMLMSSSTPFINAPTFSRRLILSSIHIEGKVKGGQQVQTSASVTSSSVGHVGNPSFLSCCKHVEKDAGSKQLVAHTLHFLFNAFQMGKILHDFSLPGIKWNGSSLVNTQTPNSVGPLIQVSWWIRKS